MSRLLLRQPFCACWGPQRASCLLLHCSPSVTCPQRPRNHRSQHTGARIDHFIAYSSSHDRHIVRRSTSNPVQFIQAAELAALSVAAIYQAAVLVNAALQQLSARQERNEAAFAAEPIRNVSQDQLGALQEQQQTQQALLQQPISIAVQQHTAGQTLAGSQLQSVALLVALMCGAALRYLQRPRSPTGVPSADAAARLVAVEITSQQQAAQLTTMARQLDKLQARVRLATSDLKVPIRQAQGSATQAAAALSRLAEQQQQLQKQLDGSQELIAALQGLAAKQFKVSAEALQQLKSSQSQLSSNTTTALSELRQQQQTLQQQLEQQRRQIAAVEWQQHQNKQQQQPDGIAVSHNGGGSASSSSSSDSSGSSSSNGDQIPDPWSRGETAAQLNGSSGGSSSSSKGDQIPDPWSRGETAAQLNGSSGGSSGSSNGVTKR